MIQVDDMLYAVEACATFQQCHTAAISLATQGLLSVLSSETVRRKCRCRWRLQRFSCTFAHEQPSLHEQPVWHLPLDKI